MTHLCFECEEQGPLCGNCHRCVAHCNCYQVHKVKSTFTADELGIDPEDFADA